MPKRKYSSNAQGVVLGECAQEFAELAANPFRRKTKACLPVAPNLDTERVTVTDRGVITIDASGNGWLSVSPRLLLASDYLTAGAAAIQYSNGNIAVTTDFSTNSGTQAQTATNSNALSNYYVAQGDSKYVTADFGEGTLMYRMMVCGAQVKYTGRMDELSGVIQGFVHPTSDSITGMSTDDLFQRGATRHPVRTKSDFGCIKVPSMPNEFSFSASLSIPEEGGDAVSRCIGILITGCEPGATFEFEVASHFEVVGEKALPQARPTVSDPIATELVNNIANPLKTGGDRVERVAKVLEGVKTTTSNVAKIGKIGSQILEIVHAALPAVSAVKALSLYDNVPQTVQYSPASQYQELPLASYYQAAPSLF